MKKPKLISFWGEETNSFANSSTCNNGGGYFQPCGGALWTLPNRKMVTVDIDDLSCGDFGDRVFVCIDDGIHIWRFCYGTMLDVCIDSDYKIASTLRSAEGCLKVDIRKMMRETYAAIRYAAYNL